MTAATKTPAAPRKRVPAEPKETTSQKRSRFLVTIAALVEDLTRNEISLGRVLQEALATFPDTTDGRKAFYSWAEKGTGRKSGMIRRWMTSASVIHRAPMIESVTTKADSLQFLAGLPDADIAAIAATLEGKPATLPAIKKVALKVSESAVKREARRASREADAAASDRVKNAAAVEQIVSRRFAKVADDLNTLCTQAETDPHDAILLCASLFASLGAKHGQMPAAVNAMIKKYRKGDHLEDQDQ